MGSQSRSPVPTKIITANIINTQVLQNPQQQCITSHQQSPPPQHHQILVSSNGHAQNGNKVTNGCLIMNGDHNPLAMNGTNNGAGQTLLGPFKVYSEFSFFLFQIMHSK